MLDGPRDGRVGDAGNGARGIEFAEAQGLLAIVGQETLGPLECAELDGHTRANTQQGGQRALVESQGTVGLQDLRGTVERRGVRGGVGLDADFDDVEGLGR